jgi:hypothetical protein
MILPLPLSNNYDEDDEIKNNDEEKSACESTQSGVRNHESTLPHAVSLNSTVNCEIVISPRVEGEPLMVNEVKYTRYLLIISASFLLLESVVIVICTVILGASLLLLSLFLSLLRIFLCWSIRRNHLNRRKANFQIIFAVILSIFDELFPIFLLKQESDIVGCFQYTDPPFYTEYEYFGQSKYLNQTMACAASVSIPSTSSCFCYDAIADDCILIKTLSSRPECNLILTEIPILAIALVSLSSLNLLLLIITLVYRAKALRQEALRSSPYIIVQADNTNVNEDDQNIIVTADPSNGNDTEENG